MLNPVDRANDAILPDVLFVIPTSEVLKRATIPARCMLAVYEMEEGKLVAAVRSRKALIAATSGQAYPLLGCFLRSRSELRRQLPMPVTSPETLRRRALFGQIATPIRLSREILTSARAELGSEFERELRATLVNELRATGRPPGDRPTRQENRRMIELLQKTSKKCTGQPVALKQLVPTNRERDLERWAKSASVRLGRFCRRVYRVWREVDFPTLHLAWFRERLAAECSFEFPQDECAVLAALEHGARLAKAAANRSTRLETGS